VSVLAGGIARQGETCGAIIGALAALGLIVGREKIQDSETYRAAMVPAMELYNRFKTELEKEYGKGAFRSTICRYIQERLYGRGFIMTDPKEREAFEAAGGHSDKGCPLVCAVAAGIAAEKLSDLKLK
jgi:hypothetical protein